MCSLVEPQPVQAADKLCCVFLQAAVPKFMQLRLEPASGSTLPAGTTDAAKQTLHVKNSMHGQKSLVMRLRISYTVGGASKLEQAEVKNFPAGL